MQLKKPSTPTSKPSSGESSEYEQAVRDLYGDSEKARELLKHPQRFLTPGTIAHEPEILADYSNVIRPDDI